MSRDFDDSELIAALEANKQLLVLFYASWCPFSRRFLPIYEKCTANSKTPCLRVMIDDRDDICEKYSIAIFPTVLLFENGKVVTRLDGKPGEGLSETQLQKLLDGK
jgi:thioredoxin-like negative regulator of GroEL